MLYFQWSKRIYTIFLLVVLYNLLDFQYINAEEQADDCTECCKGENRPFPSLSCCTNNERRSFLGTPYGECSGLPCCKYNGRINQRHESWYPCILFPTCQGIPTKDFCKNEATWTFLDDYERFKGFSCTDSCCKGPTLEANVFRGVENAIPGQTDATFALILNPDDYRSIFLINKTYRDRIPLIQIIIRAPVDYKFNSGITCAIGKTLVSSSLSNGEKTNCEVSQLREHTYLTVTIPPAYQMNTPFTLTFNHVITPSGQATIEDIKATKNVPYSTDTNLAPIYFLFDDPDDKVYVSFFHVSSLGEAQLTSGSFLPKNMYPGDEGEASLMFYSDAQIPKNSTIHMKFKDGWNFEYQTTQWYFGSVQQPQTSSLALELESQTNDTDGSLQDVERILDAVTWGKLNTPADSSFDSSLGSWKVMVDQVIPKGWVSLYVNKVKTPAVRYSGLNVVNMDIFDPDSRKIVAGKFSSISIELSGKNPPSPYNYVSVAVLVGSLLFCSIVIRSNGLSFSLGSIWTDLTAICTILALCTAMINNFLWAISPSANYYYISRLYMCFTFTMLTAVCFHWGTVLNLQLRKLPTKNTCITFIVLNVLFYMLQGIVLYRYHDLIKRVYEPKDLTLEIASCRHEDATTTSSGMLFSEIQGYIWNCKAHNNEHFFSYSTYLTSGVFLALTITVMVLGLMVLRRGKSLLGSASESHQAVLTKALRLYYALIGVVTCVYLLSNFVQFASTTRNNVPDPWYYIFTVWLPWSIPPCCLIFLQWNSTANSLQEADNIDHGWTANIRDGSSPSTTWGEYEEIHTPILRFSPMDQWGMTVDSDDEFDKFDKFEDANATKLQADTFRRSQLFRSTNSWYNSTIGSENLGLSMSLEMNENFPHGCFIAVQRMQVDPKTNASSWTQLGQTDIAEAVRPGLTRQNTKDSQYDTGHISHADISTSSITSVSDIKRYTYNFVAIQHIPTTSSKESIRLVVCALYVHGSSVGSLQEARHQYLFQKMNSDHSEITAANVLAALDRTSMSQETRSSVDLTETSVTNQTPTDFVFDATVESSIAIEELFDMTQSDDGEEDASVVSTTSGTQPRLIPTIVAEFIVSSDTIVTAGARREQISLSATEHSYKMFGPDSIPPVLSIHTFMPKSQHSNLRLTQTGKQPPFSGSKLPDTRVEDVAEDLPLSPLYSISSQFVIREQKLLVVEDLTESRFSNWIPRQVLERIICYRTKHCSIAKADLDRLKAYAKQRQKGNDRGIYENLIEQIQDDGDLTQCRDWLEQRLSERQEYVKLLKRLRRQYLRRDAQKVYFKPSTDKKNSALRFLPINLHLQEMWVSNLPQLTRTESATVSTSESYSMSVQNTAVYETVTVGAMAAHIYKFKNGGIMGLEEQSKTLNDHCREYFNFSHTKKATSASPMWSQEEQKANSLDWEIQKRMDVCFPQAVAALVTGFTRKIDLALQNANSSIGEAMLNQLATLGFLFHVESLVSTHGNEAGMLEDMAAAVKELQHISFVLVEDEEGSKSPATTPDQVTVSFLQDFEESKHAEHDMGGVKSPQSITGKSDSSGSSTSSMIAGVIDVDIFSNLDSALSPSQLSARKEAELVASSGSSIHDDLNNSPSSPFQAATPSGFGGVKSRLMSVLSKATAPRSWTGRRQKSGSQTGRKYHSTSTYSNYEYTHMVIRVKVRTTHVKLPHALAHGNPIYVTPVLFTQGINEKQTIANNTKSAATRLQDIINITSIRILESYCEDYIRYIERQTNEFILPFNPLHNTRESIKDQLHRLETIIMSSKQGSRKKRVEILQLSADLCRDLNGGRTTVCKSAKDRTGMSVTLEQGRILVQKHGLPERRKAAIVAAMRSEGVRIENALKNTGRRVFAFNALQRSLLPEEYRCPPQTGGRNVS